MGGPFNPQITPIHSSIRYRNRTDKWHVFVSRQIEAGDGRRYESSRQAFDTYTAALTYVSVFWGNA